MADETSVLPSVEASAPVTAADPIEPAHTNGVSSDIPKEDEQIAGKQATTEVNPPYGDGTAEVADPPSAAGAERDTELEAVPPSTGKKETKRKSIGSGIPEHKSKKLNKKKSMPTLHLECKPGDFFWARLKGYPPWPSVVCDEQMLPESLLASRPVSTARPDGSIRDDFKEGGKNAKERTFPMMFLATNEFTWMVNTSLTPLDPEECKTLPKSKMTKDLAKAWQIASEGHDLQYFKGILKQWQEEQAQFEEELRQQEELEAAAAEERRLKQEEDAALAATEEVKPKKKSKKKSDADVVMEDADEPKSSKKRKKDVESEGDGAKPKKTPKSLKLNVSKTPNGEASAKKSATKSKKKVVQAPTADEDEKPQLTEAERRETLEKAILYLRHRLQKGFLSRDQAPQESEMGTMADFFSQLEAYENLEPAIIRSTKVHKVLKAIVKLSSIPKEEEYNFKKRSAALLEIWNKRMEADVESAPASAVEPKSPAPKAATPATNGEAKVGAEEDAKVEQKPEVEAAKLDEKVEPVGGDEMDVVVQEPPAAPVEATEPGNDAKDEATDGEVPKPVTVEEVVDAAA